ncbi:hypothetical protein EDC52_10810 [Biostraticola tofi]|uniref:Uncharacterized protein n=1 Tax=Biostraticola tofi TaxID=466109 RepID=A0A4R3YPW0_9GAMM|nr:hypothetical protein EDC52_10810 [Biostraticola tofi]
MNRSNRKDWDHSLDVIAASRLIFMSCAPAEIKAASVNRRPLRGDVAVYRQSFSAGVPQKVTDWFRRQRVCRQQVFHSALAWL